MEIYFIRNSTNDKVYIGKTTVGFTIRKSGHLGRLRKGKHINPHLQRAYNQNPDAFTFELFATASTPDDLSRMEIGLIALYQAGESEYGYNMTWGGEGKWGTPLKTHCPRGHEFTPENTYTKRSRPNSRECRICRRMGRPKPKPSPLRIAKPKVRTPRPRLSEETKRKISESHKGEKNYRYGVRYTHCLRGHPYDDANTYIKKRGDRRCRACKQIHDTRYRARNHTLVTHPEGDSKRPNV